MINASISVHGNSIIIMHGLNFRSQLRTGQELNFEKNFTILQENVQLGQLSVIPPGLVLEVGGTST